MHCYAIDARKRPPLTGDLSLDTFASDAIGLIPVRRSLGRWRLERPPPFRSHRSSVGSFVGSAPVLFSDHQPAPDPVHSIHPPTADPEVVELGPLVEALLASLPEFLANYRG